MEKLYKIGRWLKRLMDYLIQPIVWLVILAYGAVLWIRLQPHMDDKRRIFFVLFEAGALFFATVIATINYTRIERRVADIFGAGTSERLGMRYYEFSNIACFLLATWYILEPAVHVAWLGAVYLFFSISNVHHSHWICNCTSVPDKHRERLRMMMEARAWLRTENGPSLFGLTSLSAALVVLTLYPSKDIVAVEALESFAAGAALLHLSLSVIGFTVHLGENPEEKALYEAINVDQVSAVMAKRTAGSDLWWCLGLGICALCLTAIVSKGPRIPEPAAALRAPNAVHATPQTSVPAQDVEEQSK